MITEDIKQHYNLAARNRRERLISESYNVWQFNHAIRERIIRKFIEPCGYLHKGIDIGTGTGVWAEVLTDYCENVEGIDFAEENIKIASENANILGIRDRLSYSVGDAQTLEGVPDKYYDIATLISVLQHIPDQSNCIKRIYDILDNNGYIIILVHNKKCIYNRNLIIQQKNVEKISVNEYSVLFDIIKQLQSSGFHVLKFQFLWLFFNDFILLGRDRWFLKPFNGLQKILVTACSQLDFILGRFTALNFLFRELVIVARKDR